MILIILNSILYLSLVSLERNDGMRRNAGTIIPKKTRRNGKKRVNESQLCQYNMQIHSYTTYIASLSRKDRTRNPQGPDIFSDFLGFAQDDGEKVPQSPVSPPSDTVWCLDLRFTMVEKKKKHISNLNSF